MREDIEEETLQWLRFLSPFTAFFHFWWRNRDLFLIQSFSHFRSDFSFSSRFLCPLLCDSRSWHEARGRHTIPSSSVYLFFVSMILFDCLLLVCQRRRQNNSTKEKNVFWRQIKNWITRLIVSSSLMILWLQSIYSATLFFASCLCVSLCISSLFDVLERQSVHLKVMFEGEPRSV